MNKWNIIEKLKFSLNSKIEEKNQIENKDISEELFVEYNETLISGQIQKKKSSIELNNMLPSNQRIWRDVNTIEENIDELNGNKTYHTSTDINGKVDRLFSRKR